MAFIFGFTGFIVLLIIILIMLSSCVKIVPQAQAMVVERLGAYKDRSMWSRRQHMKPLTKRKRIMLRFWRKRLGIPLAGENVHTVGIVSPAQKRLTLPW